MKRTLPALIAAQEASFSKGQRRIAQYVVEHYDEAAFMTAQRLGEVVGVSESTVVRFAAELGLDGYPELQKAVQEMLRSRLNTLQRIEVSRMRMTESEVPDRVMAYDIVNVRQTLEELPREVFEAAAEALAGAETVYIFGAGSCRALAGFLAHYLRLLLKNVHLISASGEAEIFEELLRIGEKDALIGVSFPRYSTRAVKTLHFARDRGAQVIAVTDSQLSPVAEYATHLLLAHSDLATIVDSLVAPLSILNALIVAISLKTVDQNRPMLAELEEIWKKYEVYQPLREELE
mgnify:FL=1